MRGKETPARAAGWTERITPAYAGKSKKLQFYRIRQRDHPRLCGEKATRRRRKVKKIGSPPPMRGKGFSKNCGHVEMGITPAYAGKSSNRRTGCGICWDHPRLCGEKLLQCGICGRKVGITPAYAGKRNHRH